MFRIACVCNEINVSAQLFIILCAINWYAARKTLISRIITENRKNKNKTCPKPKEFHQL